MKGIILAAGKGTRLYPITVPVCKPLLPVYNKPLIYYLLSTLIQSGVDDVLIICPPGETDPFYELLGDGSSFGISISYTIQPVAKGIADAFIIAKNFIGNEPVVLVLGDNIFYSSKFEDTVTGINEKGATVFGIYQPDPRAFGVVEFDKDGNVLSLEEKPSEPKSNYIVPGLYFYDNDVVSIAKHLKPSKRGELEITDVNKTYLERKELKVKLMSDDVLWFDCGTPDSILKASTVICNVEKKDLYIGFPQIEAYKMGKISIDELTKIQEMYHTSEYGSKLKNYIDSL